MSETARPSCQFSFSGSSAPPRQRVGEGLAATSLADEVDEVCESPFLALPQDRDAELARALLQSRGVHVSVRGRVVRVAPHAYDDMDDLDALLRGLGASVA